MPNKINLILLYGGKSGEHEISLMSAASVLKHLKPDMYHIMPVGIDKAGCLFLNDYQTLLKYPDSLPVRADNAKPLASLLIDGKSSLAADVIFPVVHGPLYEDGCLQGLLKLTDTPFVGSDVLASAIGMDKDIARRLVDSTGVAYAQYRTLSWHASSSARQQFCEACVHDLGWPLFVKPASLGSSVGIHKAHNMEALLFAVEDALRYDETILVEAFIQGREIEVAVLENRDPTALPRVSIPGEIRVHHPDGFYSYAAKYLDSAQSEALIPAKLNETLTEQVQRMAADIFTALKCKGLARVDFFVNEQTQKIYFNEINTLPGFTSISMYPKLWEASGLLYSDLLDELVRLALMHYDCRQQLVTNYR